MTPPASALAHNHRAAGDTVAMTKNLKTLLVVGIACLLGSQIDRAAAQVINNSASTAGESYARGLSSVISSAGDYNLNTSQAAINMTQAQHNEIQNRQEWTNTYFEMRETNRAYRAKERGPNLSPEQLVRYAQMGKPRPLTPSEFDRADGRILWPSVFQMDDFSDQRDKLDQIFAKRAQRGGLSFDEQMDVRTTTDQMLGTLKEQIAKVPSQMYAAARSFLKSLAYEGMKG
jgi:hypothetical protein